MSSREQPVGVSDQLDASPARDGCERRDLREITVGIKAIHSRNIRHMHTIKPTVRNNRIQYHALSLDLHIRIHLRAA